MSLCRHALDVNGPHSYLAVIDSHTWVSLLIDLSSMLLTVSRFTIVVHGPHEAPFYKLCRELCMCI